MYTNTGVVSSQAVVDGYLRRQALPTGCFSRTNVPTPYANTLAIFIRDNKQVSFVTYYPNQTDTVKANVTSQQEKYAVISQRDSASTLSSASAPNRCAQLAEQMLAEMPAKRCVPAPSTTGYSRSCKYRPVQVVAINDGQLSIPLLSAPAAPLPTALGTCSTRPFSTSWPWATRWWCRKGASR